MNVFPSYYTVVLDVNYPRWLWCWVAVVLCGSCPG